MTDKFIPITSVIEAQQWRGKRKMLAGRVTIYPVPKYFDRTCNNCAHRIEHHGLYINGEEDGLNLICPNDFLMYTPDSGLEPDIRTLRTLSRDLFYNLYERYEKPDKELT